MREILRGSSERGVDQFEFEIEFGSTTQLSSRGGWTGSSSSSSSDRQHNRGGGGPVRVRVRIDTQLSLSIAF